MLDGFERFLADAAQVAQLLGAVPNLTVLATSRAPLRLTAEHAYRVQPLATANAAALFAARVTRQELAPTTTAWWRRSVRGWTGCRWRPSWPPTARGCSRSGAAPRLERRLELLSCGPHDLPERQRSLRATLEWSWEALDPAQRRLLAGCACSRAALRCEAFQAVCNPEARPPRRS